MKISEILWKAANEHLCTGSEAEYFWSGPHDKWRESCLAAAEAEGTLGLDGQWSLTQKRSQVIRFLKTLGCRTGANHEFARFDNCEDRQGARYAWLMFASLVAEEQGL